MEKKRRVWECGNGHKIVLEEGCVPYQCSCGSSTFKPIEGLPSDSVPVGHAQVRVLLDVSKHDVEKLVPFF